MTLDIVATERHFLDHVDPIWQALPADARGMLVTSPDVAGLVTASPGSSVLVASYGDHKRARALGYDRIARIEHGAGQSYGGDPATARKPNYAGGRDADDVTLFLVPGPYPGRRWQAAYPGARVEVVGCPRLDDLPRREPDGDRVVALSFHFNAFLGCPEGDSAWRWYRDHLFELGKRFNVIGHAHPRWAARIRPWFERAGITFVPDFADVCRRADVYATDNSSTLFEFAATGRPVVVLNCPGYRKTVDHGLRFWDAAHIGIPATPATLADAIERALEDRAEDQMASEDALHRVYRFRTGAARRAAEAIADWMEVA